MRKPKKEDIDLNFDNIVRYNMSELEAKAYKVAILWIDRSRKVFPDYRHATMTKGDPRKSLIFKICYKLIRETQGVLEDHEYPLYVRAQLDVLKYINNGRSDPLIDPNCLVGEKAWKRWKLWKRKYDSLSKTTSNSSITQVGIEKALDGLEKTKEFLVKTFSSDLSFERYNEAYLNKNIFRWVNLNKISPYYLAISPFIKKLFSEDDFKKINFDLQVYLHCIDDTVKEKFKQLFEHEKLDSCI